MENAITVLNYKSEGDAARVLGSQAPGTIPFYRAYHPTVVDHFYTTDVNERNNAIQNLGYHDEGIVGYIYPSELCCAIPLYRLYNPTVYDHFYTRLTGMWSFFCRICPSRLTAVRRTS